MPVVWRIRVDIGKEKGEAQNLIQLTPANLEILEILVEACLQFLDNMSSTDFETTRLVDDE